MMMSQYQLLPLKGALLLWLVGSARAAIAADCSIPRDAQTMSLTRERVTSYPRDACDEFLEKYLAERRTSFEQFKEEEKHLKTIIMQDASIKRYPGCVYSPLCSEKVEIAKHWTAKVTFAKGETLQCWNVRPIRWVTCVKSHDCEMPIPAHAETKTRPQLVCEPWLIRRKVLMCCKTRDNPIRQVEIKVPEQCTTWAHSCQ